MEAWLGSIPILAIIALVAVVVTLESLGLPLPGETVMIAGVLAALASGHEWWWVAIAAAVGAIVGDNIGYEVGHRFGDRLFELGRARLPRVFSEAKVARATTMMEKHGAWAVFFGRFVALLRIFAGPLAGSLHMPRARFFLANAAGAIVWAGAVGGLTALLGAAAERIIHALSWGGLAVVILGVLVVAVVVLRSAGVPVPAGIRRVAHRVWALVRRVPVTTIFIVGYLALGIATTSLWHAAVTQPWYATFAYGVPSLEAGRWWTPLTGSALSQEPMHYAIVIVLAAVGLGLCEWRRGSAFTGLALLFGQLGAVLGAAAFLEVVAGTGWPWAASLHSVLDMGPSGGVVAAFCCAIATLPSPWRLRLRLGTGAVLLVLLLLGGTLADLIHAIAGGAVLIFGFGHGRVRASVREWRHIVFTATVTIVFVQLIAVLLPTSGPFGITHPAEAAWLDIAIDLVVILLVGRGLLKGRRWAWVVTLVLVILNVLQGVLVVTVFDELIQSTEGVELTLAASTLWLAAGFILFAGRHAFQSSWRRSRRFVSESGDDARTRAIDALRARGGGTLAWMTTWSGIRYVFPSAATAGAAPEWAIGIARAGDVALALGDPFGPIEDRAAALTEWRERCERDSLVPAVFGASRELREASSPEWRALQVAEDTVVPVTGLEFTGKPWAPIRQAVNRGEREGITFRMVALADQPWAIRAQVRAISEQWVGDKGLPEMGFTLGTVDDALDPEVLVALAVDGDGSVHGVLSWLPIYGPAADDGTPVIRGWLLDVMRRRDGGFPPVMEFLIGHSLLHFRDLGAEFASLSAAPLARDEAQAANDTEDGQGEGDGRGVIDAVLERVGEFIEPVYGFRSLHRFKQKFNPVAEPMYLLYRDEGDLPAVGIALMRAYLPEASALDFARMGLSLTKSGS